MLAVCYRVQIPKDAYTETVLAMAVCEQDGVTPLYVAAQNKRTDVVQALVESKADVNRFCTIKVRQAAHVRLSELAAKPSMGFLLIGDQSRNHQDY